MDYDYACKLMGKVLAAREQEGKLRECVTVLLKGIDKQLYVLDEIIQAVYQQPED